MNSGFDSCTWKIVAFAEIAGFTYLFWAVFNAADAGFVHL